MIAANLVTSRRAPLPACSVATDGCMKAMSRQCLERELRAAIGAEMLILHYQPRFCLATGQIMANEALIQWLDPEQGLIPPSVVFPFAEQSGLVNLIGDWMLAEACREAAHWSAVRLAVNITARQLRSGALPIQLTTALEQSGLPPDRLELGLTASLLVDSNADTLLALSAIRDLGIGLALGDFDIGFATLSMLKRFPLTAMKLDRSLVHDLPASREDAVIVRTMIETGRAIRLTTVAGGIETEAQRAFLSGIGCDEGQGCLFSHPVSATQLRPKLSLARS